LTELVRDAAKEAVKIADLLVVCGFAFDPLVVEEASSLGRLTIVRARMNPDLAMGDELLKKTGTGNLFMVFGEPDIEVREVPSNGSASDPHLQVEIRGLDVYDPTTGQVRSSSTDDIAAWFLDTDYDGDAFFVRHAYFTGSDDPYDKLRRAPARRHLRRRLGDHQLDRLPPLPAPPLGQDHHQGDQPLWRRGAQGDRAVRARRRTETPHAGGASSCGWQHRAGLDPTGEDWDSAPICAESK